MAAKKFKLDQEAFRKVRQDPRVRADLLKRGQKPLRRLVVRLRATR